VSVRVRTEQALQASETRYRTVSWLMFDYVFAVHIAPESRPVLEWSAGVFPGGSDQEIDTIIPPEVWQRLTTISDQPTQANASNAILYGDAQVIEVQAGTSASESRWFKLQAYPEWSPIAQRVTRVVGALKDITERKQIAMALRTFRARFQAVVQAAPMAVIVLSPDGVIQLWNPAAEQIFGWKADEVLGQVLPMVLPDQQDEVRAFLAQVSAGETITGQVVRQRRRNDTPIDLLVVAAPLYESAGAVSSVLALMLDLTEIEALRANRERLQTLSHHLLNAQESERRRVAQVLHDEIGQTLTALRLALDAARDETDMANRVYALDEGEAIVDRLLQQVRTLARDLRPSVLDDFGLVAALRSYLDRQAERGGFTRSLSIEGSRAAQLESARLPGAVEIACFRVTQEALTNVLRHSQADQVRITLRAEEDILTMQISDNGAGFDLETARKRGAAGDSMGLLGMEEQVTLAGGVFAITTAPGTGTRIELRFPLTNSNV
jgi:two-component system sensor histidine kinase UhpB